MAYEIEVYPEAQEQILALPSEAPAALAEAITMLELAPWNGAPLNTNNPNGAVRVVPFGQHGAGMVTYLILEEQSRVDVLRVVWFG